METLSYDRILVIIDINILMINNTKPIFCHDSEFRSMVGASSEDVILLVYCQ